MSLAFFHSPYARRVVLALYLLCVAYACAWVPWVARGQGRSIRLGYGFVWAGPRQAQPHLLRQAQVDLVPVGLRLVLLSALFGTVFVLLPSSRHAPGE